MKEINLREFYPEIYKTDLFISLPDEVVDVLVEYQPVSEPLPVHRAPH